MKIVKVGTMLSNRTHSASFRFRFLLPSFYMHSDLQINASNAEIFLTNQYGCNLENLKNKIKNKKLIFDIAFNHFDDRFGNSVREIAKLASVLTCSSRPLKELIFDRLGREAIYIPDPYETPEMRPHLDSNMVLWFGQPTGLKSLENYYSLENLVVITKDINLYQKHSPNTKFVTWTPRNEYIGLTKSSTVLITTDNIYCSPNRVIKALRAGKFVITPNTNIYEWNTLKEFMWQGDVFEGIEWVKNNKLAAIEKIKEGQRYIKHTYSPVTIAKLWDDVFLKTLLGNE